MLCISHHSSRNGLICSLAMAMAALSGCSNVEYQLVQPAALAQPIGGQTVTVRREPLEYQLTTVEDHLVVQIYNRSTGPITLLGGWSRIVDPVGQSHPLSSQMIPARQYVKLVLPPVHPIHAPPEPSGFPHGYYGPEFHGNDPFWDGPPYYPDPYSDSPPPPPANDGNEGSYWRWDHGEVRLDLAYLNGVPMPSALSPSTTSPTGDAIGLPPGSFTQEFVFRQQKL